MKKFIYALTALALTFCFCKKEEKSKTPSELLTAATWRVKDVAAVVTACPCPDKAAKGIELSTVLKDNLYKFRVDGILVVDKGSGFLCTNKWTLSPDEKYILLTDDPDANADSCDGKKWTVLTLNENTLQVTEHNSGYISGGLLEYDVTFNFSH